MLYLHQPPPSWGLPSVSPFCVKLETYLRMTKIPYKIKAPSFGKAPTGKIPYITDDGVCLGDSGLIIDYLMRKHGHDLDSWLSPEQKAQSLALRCLLEEHTYFAMLWLRWSDESSWQHVRAYMLKLLPPVLGPLLLPRLRRRFINRVVVQGIGRFSRDDIVRLAKRDIDAFSVWLGDKQYFMGDRPSLVDASLYGFLVHILWTPWTGAVEEHARAKRNLQAYCERMRAEYWAG